MPKYNTSGTGNTTLNPIIPAALWPGDECYVWGTAVQTPGQIAAPNDTNVVTEAVAVGDRSLAVSLAPRPGGGSAAGIMVQIKASANPGVCEIDVQESAVDCDGGYLTNTTSAAWKITVWTANGDGTFIAWTELQPEGARFVSLKCVTNPNAVKFQAKIAYV